MMMAAQYIKALSDCRDVVRGLITQAARTGIEMCSRDTATLTSLDRRIVNRFVLGGKNRHPHAIYVEEEEDDTCESCGENHQERSLLGALEDLMAPLQNKKAKEGTSTEH